MASEALAWLHLAVLVGTVVLGGVVVSNNSRALATSHVESVLAELQRASVSHGGVGMRNVALGFNANVDLVCKFSTVVAALGAPSPPPLSEAIVANKISTQQEFLSTFAFYFRQGSAAERRVDDPQLFASIVASLVDEDSGLPLEGCEFHTGGNAALMSNVFSSLGVKTTLAGPVGSRLEALLHPDVEVATNSDALEEVHLILEYQRGDEWRGDGVSAKSPRANRFIVSHDVQNSHMNALEVMDGHLASLSPSSLPDVVTVAGAHLLEGLTETERSERLSVLEKSLKGVNGKGVAVHFEYAGVGDEEVLQSISHAVLPHSQSIGMNEQELGALYTALGGSTYAIDAFTAPTVHVAIHAIEHILSLPIAKGITRVHLHYLTFHLIAQRTHSQSAVEVPWKREAAEQSVAAGALMTTTVACGEADGSLDPRKVRIQPFSIAESGDTDASASLFLRFSSPVSGLEFRIAPVLVCTSPTRTVGLGDSISAAGLAYHITPPQ